MFIAFKFLPKSIVICIVMILSLVLVAEPVVAYVHNGNNNKLRDDQTACADAERQAELDINTGNWFLIGCLAGIIGYIIALQKSNPPATILIGKSEEYVAAFSDCYGEKTKELKSKNALNGCLVGTLVSVLLQVIIIANSDTSTDN